MRRFLVIGYLAKDAEKEFTSVKGYVLEDGEAIPSYLQIRRHCLDWAEAEGGDFTYFKMNFMQFLSEDDYKSFMQ